ncbi:MAG: extracellular solute-binding protein [Sphaerochaeta sp.]|jgi:multiple sugar transport system substrate-binding protein|nr:extracellular solute-binding protein [Sphaerochaeta sp.]
MKRKPTLIVLLCVLVVSGIAFGVWKMKRPVVLEIGIFTGSNWGVQAEDSYHIFDVAIKKFEQTHPGVKCHYTAGVRINDYSEWLASRFIEGKGPDVFLILEKDFNLFASHGLLQNLDELLEKDASFSHEAFFQSALNAGHYGQHQYALPYEVDMQLMGVNVDLLEENGFALPSQSWTWNQFGTMVQALTKDSDGDGNLDTYGEYDYTWEDAVFSNGVSIFSEDGKNAFLTDSRFVDSVRFLQRLRAIVPEQILSQRDFDQGCIAFMPISFAQFRSYTSYPYTVSKEREYRWQFTTMPAGPKGDNVSRLETVLMAVSNSSSHAKLAYDFLMTCTYDSEIQMQIYSWGQGASPLKSVTGNPQSMALLQEKFALDDKQYDEVVLTKVLSRTVSSPKFGKYDEAYALVDNGVNQIITNQSNANAMLRSLQRQLATILE